MPLNEMSWLISQLITDDEPWFSSNLHDYSMLCNGTFGQMMVQTLEFVQVQSRGIGMTFLVSDYLNLSMKKSLDGCLAYVGSFVISLEHQKICLGLVLNAFERQMGLLVEQNE